MAEQANPNVNVSSSMPFPRGFQAQAPGFSEWQLNPVDVMELIEHCLRGHYWSAEKRVWITENYENKVLAAKCKPLLDEEGIQHILRAINVMVNRIVTMSNWNEKQLQDWLLDNADMFASVIFLYSDIWHIAFEDLETVHFICMLPTEANMRRALLEGERRRLYEAVRQTDTIVRTEQQKQGGWMSMIPGIGKKSEGGSS